MLGAFHFCFVEMFHETHISYKHVVSNEIKLCISHFDSSAVELIVLSQKCHSVLDMKVCTCQCHLLYSESM